MNLLGYILPGPSILYKFLAGMLVVVAIFMTGWIKRGEHEQKLQQQLYTKQLNKALEDQKKIFDITLKTEQENNKKTEVIKTVTKYVRERVKNEKPSANCMLSLNWVQLHNQATTSTISGTPSINNETPSGITADKALDTITENYGICQEIRQQAQSCQDWIKEQKEFSGKQK